jgi:hypothetical protein
LRRREKAQNAAASIHTATSGGGEINHPAFVGETSSKPVPKSPVSKKGAAQKGVVAAKQEKVVVGRKGKQTKAAPKAFAAAAAAAVTATVGLYKLNPLAPQLERAWFQPLSP